MARLSSPQSWVDFYSTLSRELPKLPHPTTLGMATRQLDLLVDLSKLSTTGASGVYAFGDVVLLPPLETTMDFSSGPGFLYVVGRIFSANEPCQLNIQVSEFPVRLIFYLTEAQQPLHVIFSRGSSTLARYSLDGNNIGVKLTFRDRASRPGETPGLTEERYQVLEETLRKQPRLNELMQMQLRVAILTMYTNPELSSDLLSFVFRLISGSHTIFHSYIRASTIKGWLANHPNAHLNVCFVPPVTMRAYESSLNALLDSASSYSAHYDRFVAEKATMDARYDAAYAMAEQQKAAAIAQIQLLTQARIAWKNAHDALSVARQNSSATELEVLKKSGQFFHALRPWAQEKRRDATLKIVGTVIMSAVSIGGIMAGNIAGAAGVHSLIAEIASLLKLVRDIEDVAEKFLDDVGIQQTSIENIVAIFDNAIEDTSETITTILTRRFGVTDADRLGAAESDSTNAIAHWDSWIIGIRNSMEAAIGEDIPYAKDYLLVLERQVVYGKAYCLTKAAAIKAGKEYAQALLHSQAMDDHSAEWVADLQAGKDELLAKSVTIFDRLLDIKVSIVGELHNYKNLYKHFTLHDSRVVLDMRKSLLELQLDFAILKQELVAYLSASSSDPQPFSFTTMSDELPLNQGTIVEDLRCNGQFTITLNQEHCGPFAGLIRVRLNGLRIWLDGARSTVGKTVPVKLRIQTTGLYEDFSNTESLTFATQPLRRAFWYEMPTQGIRGNVLVDAVVPEVDHSPPTPFAQWTVSLVNPQDVDLSGLKSIVIDWVGTAYTGD